MSSRSAAARSDSRNLTQADCLRTHSARVAAAQKTKASSSTVSEAVEDATLFMVHYLQEVQGPKYVVGRDFVYIAATPEARRLFLSTSKHLLLQILRDAELTVTNFHDLLSLLCPDALVVAAGVFTVSYLWKWGTSRRLAHSSEHGVQLDDVIQEHDTSDGSVLSVVSSGQTLLRAPGAAVYYADNLHNLPPAFVKLLSTFPTVHNVSIFLTIRQIPVPTVGKHERMLIREMPFAGFYRAVVRYGYMDEVDQGPEFVEDVLDNIERFLAAKVAALRRNESANLDVVDAPTGGLALDFAKHTDPEDELKRLLAARGVKDVVYIRSRSRVTAAKGSNPFKKLLLSAYNIQYMFARSPIAASKIPVDSLCEIGVMYAI